jgi:hypothetical protein
MGFLLRVAAIVLLVLAALAGFGVIDAWTTRTVLGLIAAGCACAVASGLTVPTLPAPRQ